MNVIAALWLRQLKRYVRSKARIVGALGQPLLFLIGLGFGLGPVFQKAGQGIVEEIWRLCAMDWQ